MQLPNDISASI